MLTRRNFFSTLAASALLPGMQQIARAAGSRGHPRAWAVGPDNPQGEAYWRVLRKEFLIPEDEVFCNTATLGASPRVVVERVTRHIEEIERTLAHWDYRPEHPDWFSGYRPEVPLREKLGKLIHASADEIALIQNATVGMNFVAAGLTLNPGDEIVSTDQEHPGGRCGWEMRVRRSGIVWTPVAIPIPPKDPEELVRRIESALTPKTRVLAVPHITSLYGIVMPVQRLCEIARSRGIFSVVDGAQAVGQIPVDVRALGCDAYFSSPHKWLLAPKGCGFLYVRKERLGELWGTLAGSEWSSYDKGAYRLMQFGTGNLSLLRGMDAALDFNQQVGQERISERILSLGRQLRSGLQQIKGVTIHTPLHPELSAAMTTYRINNVPGPKVMDELWERRRIRVRSVGDNTGVRHSLHLYNFPEEIESALEIIRTLAS